MTRRVVQLGRLELTTRPALIGLGWIATRAIGVLMLVGRLPYGNSFARVNGDVRLYASWSHAMYSGFVPYRDFPVQYPPGVLPFVALPGPSGDAFVAEFIAATLLADLVCLCLLAYSGRPRGTLYWVVAVPLIGPVAWGRFDMFVAMSLIAAMVCLERRRPVLAGVCLAFAGLIKLWPFVLIPLVLLCRPVRGRKRLLAAAACVFAAGTIPLLALGGRMGLRYVVTFETGRGVEVESLPAVPLHIAQAAGAAWRDTSRYGSLDLEMRQAHAVASVATICLAMALLLVAAWAARTRPTNPAQIALIVVAVVLVFSKVLSAQYMIWLAGVTAVYLDRAFDPARLAVWTSLAFVSTQVVYPFMFPSVIVGSAPGLLAALLHALLVVIALVLAVREARRSSSRTAGLASHVPP
jgi:uncharacterized membrane protein